MAYRNIHIEVYTLNFVVGQQSLCTYFNCNEIIRVLHKYTLFEATRKLLTKNLKSCLIMNHTIVHINKY